MAARINLPSSLTLICRRRPLFDKIQRISATNVCSAGSWTVRNKTKREKVLYRAPKYVELEKEKKTKAVQDIKIPEKIHRSPTAILEALASTVRNDVNQPRYMTIDDPSLYCTTDRAKKAYLAAYESGCQAADHMLALYPDYFTQIWEDPLPDAWKDDTGYVHTEPCGEALLERIKKRKVTDALTMYKTLKSSGTDLSQDVQEKLLELLLVFNCKDPQKESDVEVYILAPDYQNFAPFPPNTWQPGNPAEEVFNALPEKTAKAYNNMVRGMSANFNKEGAQNLYSTMKASNIPVDLETYHALLTLGSLDTETIDDVKIYVEALLKDMSACGVQPNEKTFVSAMINCRRLSRWTGSKRFALSLLSEMKACGVEPGLSTYFEILSLFYYFKDKGSKTPQLFEQVLDELKGKEFDCRTESDGKFFRAAMGMIAAHFPDPKLAFRVHEMMHHGKNRNLLANRQAQYAYYTDLFVVIAPVEPIDKVMELYHEVVPYVYFPPSKIYKTIIESIELHESYHHLPEIYNDLQWTSMFKDFDFLSCFTQALAKAKPDPKLQGDLCTIASSLMQAYTSKQHLREGLPFNGAIIGDLMMVHLNNGDLKTSWNLFETYRGNRRMRGADPSETSMTKLAEQVIMAGDFTSTKEVLHVMTILDYDISFLVEKTVKTMSLTEIERNYLQGLSRGDLSSGSSSESSSDSE